MTGWQRFFSFLGCLHSGNCLPWCAETFMQCHFISSCSYFLSCRSPIQKAILMPMSLSSLFPSSHLKPQAYMKVFDPFGIDFCTRGEIRVQFQSSTCEYLVFSTSFVKETFFSPTCFWHLCQKIRWLWLYGFISRSAFLFHWYMCLFLCQYHAVFVIMSL
jgi:hypothetical protein